MRRCQNGANSFMGVTMRFAILFGLTLLASAAVARDTAAPHISVQTLKDVTRTLSSDAYEGRKPTTPAEEKATAYIVERFKAAGLKPGNHGSWFQPVPLIELTAQNVSPLTFTGGKAPVNHTKHNNQKNTTNRVVPKIDIDNSDVVF